MFGRVHSRSSVRSRSLTLALVIAALITSLSACGGSGSASGTQGKRPITIAVAAGATSFSTVYVAQERGYFKDEGVNVKLIDNAGANAVPMLASGQADLAFSGVAAALALGQQKPAKVVLSMLGGFSAAAIVGRNDIHGVTDLKGKKLGTPGTGTTSDAYAHIYNKRLHLGADIVPFTTPVALVAAVKSGQVDAGLGTASLYADVIASSDAHVILQAGDPDMAKVLGSVKYPEGVLFGLSDKIDKKADDVVKVIAALERASADMKSQEPSVTAATISKTSVYHATPVDVLAKNLSYDVNFILPNDGNITEDDWKVALDQFKDGGVLKGSTIPDSISYANLIDMSYFEKAQGAQ
ncbi:NitT/TauT family transport system substrate-binding protein [Marmoricola sp. URHA0025 HA25]